MVNEVTLIGNLGSDPETRSAGKGRVANFSLATTNKWKDGNGDWQEKTSWHRVAAWGYLADYVEKFAEKGTMVYVKGSIEYGSYEKNGVTVYTTAIKAEKVRVLNKWKDGGDNHQSRDGGKHGDYGIKEPPPMGEDVPF